VALPPAAVRGALFDGPTRIATVMWPALVKRTLTDFPDAAIGFISWRGRVGALDSHHE